MSLVGVDIKALHARIAAGDLTKSEAAASIGVAYSNFCSALRRAGLLDSVRTPKPSKYSTPQMAAAVAQALAIPDNVTAGGRAHGYLTRIANEHAIPKTQYPAFAMRVKHALDQRMKQSLKNKSAHQSAEHDQTTDPGAAGAG